MRYQSASIPLMEIKPMTDIQDKVIESIVQQWEGGEHMLAGQRASELVFGASNKMNQKLYDKVLEKVPGIERYVVAPSQPPVENVPDEGGYPLSRQPEHAREASTGASNASGSRAKTEQDAIDAALAPGRNARNAENASTGSTKLNPEGSDVDPKDKAKMAKTASK